MDRNDINSNYTIAYAVFAACFLNACLRHCDVVGMANFSPVVNTVGAIFTHEEGIVLRPTYHVFDLYTNHTYEEIVHSLLLSPSFEVTSNEGDAKKVKQLDAVVTRDATSNQLSIVLVNLHGEDTILCRIRGLNGQGGDTVQVKTVNGDSVDAFNDINHPNDVSIQTRTLSNVNWDHFEFECPAHSVSVLNTTVLTQ